MIRSHTQALWQTFGGPEVDGLRQRADSFGVLGLNPKVINCVKVQIHNLMGQPVTADCLHHPIIYWHVFIQRVVQDVTCQTRSYKISKSNIYIQSAVSYLQTKILNLVLNCNKNVKCVSKKHEYNSRYPYWFNVNLGPKTLQRSMKTNIWIKFYHRKNN